MRLLVLLSVAAFLLPGCTAPSDVTDSFEIDPAQYDVTFDVTREVLRTYRFQPDRVDARAGVITTASKPTAGLATPWDLEQSTLNQELADLGNHQQRRVRVTFEPVDLDEGLNDPGDPVPDVREAEGPILVRVHVFVERIRTPGWRLDATKVNLSSYTRDPSLFDRGMLPQYVQTTGRDDEFARRLARAIQRELDG